MPIPNVLADRYASREMQAIFDPTNRVRTERHFWVAVLEAQVAAGLAVSDGAVAAYREVLDEIDLESIRKRERETRHDVKARLDEFCSLAGYEDLHKGLTSRDVTENVEQVLTYQAMHLARDRTLALLAVLAERSAEYASLAIVGRTHNVPAQPTTVGKRFAQIGEEVMAGFSRLETLLERFALRGIKGPVGSQQDQLDLLGSPEAVDSVEQAVADHLGLPTVLNAVGQVYPRSWDFDVVTTLCQLSAGPSNLALLVRLMAGHDLATEGFKPGQVGSSAMPHKMNTRSCERINGLATILNGYVTMASGISGDQWNEGDVSCSVVRRLMLPDAFFAFDGLAETTFAVLGEFGVFEPVIRAEMSRYLPFVATPTLLMFAVQRGLGRETAHELIKEHAVAAALAMRAGEAGSDPFDRLARDPRFPGDLNDLRSIVDQPTSLLGLVDRQVGNFVASVGELVAERPEAASYRGAAIL